MTIPTWISSLVNDAVINAGGETILKALQGIIEYFRQGRFDGIYTSGRISGIEVSSTKGCQTVLKCA